MKSSWTSIYKRIIVLLHNVHHVIHMQRIAEECVEIYAGIENPKDVGIQQH